MLRVRFYKGVFVVLSHIFVPWFRSQAAVEYTLGILKSCQKFLRRIENCGGAKQILKKKRGNIIGLFSIIILFMFPTESLGTPNPWKQIINENLEQCADLYYRCDIPKDWKEVYHPLNDTCPENYIRLGFVDEKDRCSPPYIPPIPSHPALPNTPEFKRARLMADCLKSLDKLVVRRTRNEILAKGGQPVCSSGGSYGLPLNWDPISLNSWRENIWKKGFPAGCYDPNKPVAHVLRQAGTEQQQLNSCYRQLADERARLTGPVVTSNVRPPRLLVKRSQVHYPSVESVSSYHPPTVGPVSSYVPPKGGESESTVDKMKRTEKKLKRRTVLTGIATLALGFLAKKCCFPNKLPTDASPEAIKKAADAKFSCPPKPDPTPYKPQCPLFTALASGAAVQTFNIHKRRKDIANTRKKLETKPIVCQDHPHTLNCVCAIHSGLPTCSFLGALGDRVKASDPKGYHPPETDQTVAKLPDHLAPCGADPRSEACAQAICVAYPDSEGCISTAFHPFCIEQPEQCDKLAKVFNTCEGDACREKLMVLFTPEGGWPVEISNSADMDKLTSEQKEEIKRLVTSYMQTNSNSTGTLAGETGTETQGDGEITKEDLANQMNNMLDGAFSGNATATLAGSGEQVEDSEGEVTKEDLANQMNSMLNSAFSGGNATAALAGDLEDRTPAKDQVSKMDLASQMQNMLNTVYAQRARDGSNKRNAMSFRNPPLQMGSDYIGAKEDNIFFLTHSFHQNLCDQGYCIN